MKSTVNFSLFVDGFDRVGRGENFSYDALRALFDHIEELEESCGEEIEFDPVAICCEFEELTIDQAIEQYSLNHLVWEMDDYDKREAVINWLNDHTSVIGVDDSTVVIQQF